MKTAILSAIIALCTMQLHATQQKQTNDDSWCSGLCKAYHNNDECVAGEQQKGVRENEAKARCGFASAGCYTGGCWK